MTTSHAARRGYHHGDLRNALLEAAADLASRGGPEAATIRGAAREVGVTPTAAYRHFANQAELLTAVRQRAMTGMAEAVFAFLAQIPQTDDPVEAALARLLASGRGYVRFALEQPGLFRTCFTGHFTDVEVPTELASELDLAEKAPYALLAQVLDSLVEVGYLAPEDRPGAEDGPWAAVHGISTLLLDGPLRRAAPEDREAAIETTLRLVVRGLATGPRGRKRTATRSH